MHKPTDAELERLAMLAEECGEVVQMVGKIILHGYKSYHPNDPSTPNRILLSEEVGDIEAVLSMMRENNDIPLLPSRDILAKKERKMKYAHYQEKRDGT